MNKPTTLITGAGVRIGAALARYLAAAGHDLVLHYHRSGEAAQALAGELAAQNGARVTLVQANLEAIDSINNFWHNLPPVNTIIHNASCYHRDTLETFDVAALRRHLTVNLEAPLLMTQGFMKQLPKDSVGNVIVLGDGALGWSVSPQFFTYAASKHAWAALIDLLAAACAPRARVNLIALGPTLAGQTDADGLFERLAERAPLNRTSSPDEVWRAVECVLLSPGMTGQTLAIANGFGLMTARPVGAS